MEFGLIFDRCACVYKEIRAVAAAAKKDRKTDNFINRGKLENGSFMVFDINNIGL